MSIESAFELIGLCGAAVAVAYYQRGVRRSFATNTGLALGILLFVSALKYSINALEWSGFLDRFSLDYLEDYLDNIWPFTWFLFFFASLIALSAQRLRQSEERYRQLVETNPDAVFCHREGKIILANPAAIELFGAVSLEDLIGRDFYGLVHAGDLERLKSRR
jgi:PAS domain-containing protein